MTQRGKGISVVCWLWLLWLPFPSAGQTTTISSPESQNGFIENKGQIIDQNSNRNPDVLYLLNTPGMNVQVRMGGWSYDLYSPSPSPLPDRLQGDIFSPISGQESDSVLNCQFSIFNVNRIDFDLITCNPNCEIVPSQASPDYLNYYNTEMPGEGITFVRSYRQVTYRNIYPAIDLELLVAPDGSFKYNYRIHPGGDPERIRLHVEGAKTAIADEGTLILITPYDTIEELIPASYLRIDGITIPVTARFVQTGSREFGIRVNTEVISGAELVIDPWPTRKWGTYFGGTGEEATAGKSVVVSESGSSYYGGSTTSTGNIATSGAHQSTIGGYYDAMLIKLRPDGTRAWATYYGGTSADWCSSCTLDHEGHVLIGGRTWSTTNIATPGAWDETLDGLDDAFLVKFDTNGIRQWGTYFGGIGGLVDEFFTCLAVDEDNNILGAGPTSSPDAIATPGTTQQVLFGGPYDGFLVKFNENGQRVWGTYYGGYELEDNLKCAVGADGTIYLCGATLSSENIATPGSLMPSLPGFSSGFLAAFNPNGQRLWGTYYGGEIGG